MRRVSIVRRLTERYRWLVIGGFVVFPPVAFCSGIGALSGVRLVMSPIPGSPGIGAFSLVLVSLLLLAWGGAVGNALRRVRNPYGLPDLVRLARYGPLPNLLNLIDDELADETQVTYIGRWVRSFLPGSQGDLLDSMVWLTPSWLIHVKDNGHRMAFFRLDSIVSVAVHEYGLVVTDQHKEQRKIYGTQAGVLRLLAEILTRVPWILTHFNPAAEKTWNQNREQIIGQVSQLREERPAVRPTPAAEQADPDEPEG
jgi:hypothetical protein